MPYYHITAAKLKKEVEGVIEQRRLQRKAFRKVSKTLGVKEGYVTSKGMLGIVVEDLSKIDMKQWCPMNKSVYGGHALRPRRTKAGKEMGELLNTVPSINKSSFHKAMNFEPVFAEDMYLSSIGASKIGNKGEEKYITYLPDYAVKKTKFPKGVKEITHEQYYKWGGK